MNIGIYFEVSAPVVKGGGYLYTVRKFSSYTHNINAIGGFWDATLSYPTSQDGADEWYESGLGRQIHVLNHFGTTVWRGFVNKITITAGSQVMSRGPLKEVVNRAACIYTPRDFSVYPPVDGTTTTTTLKDDEYSKGEYGVFEQSLAGGTTTEVNAEKIRDVFIEQNRLPKTTGDFSITGAGQSLGLNLELLGNVHWLEVYAYNNYTPALITAYDKLLQVLNANTPINPGVLSTDYSDIEANAYAMEQLEDKNRYAWDVVNEILSLGNDIDDRRRLFGVYEDNKVKYGTIPSSIEYEYRLSPATQKVTDYVNGAFVYPWDVRPGKWITVPDWLIGRIIDSTDLFSDPRNKFIENVNFSAPYTLGLTGSPFDALTQMLSKITYTGGVY